MNQPNNSQGPVAADIINQHSKTKKALFTLAYLVSFELKRLLADPEIICRIDSTHFEKFKTYFQKSFGLLLCDEKNQKQSDAPYEDSKPKKINYSACFKDLAIALDLKQIDENNSSADPPSNISCINETPQQITPNGHNQSPRKVVMKQRPLSKRFNSQSTKRSQKAGRQMVIQENKTVQLMKAQYKNSLDKLAPLKLGNFRSQTPTPKDIPQLLNSHSQVRKSAEGRQNTNRSELNPKQIDSTQIEEMQKIIAKYEVCKTHPKSKYILHLQNEEHGQAETSQTKFDSSIEVMRYKKNQISKFVTNSKDDKRKSILRSNNRHFVCNIGTSQDSSLAEKLLTPVLKSQV